MTEKTW